MPTCRRAATGPDAIPSTSERVCVETTSAAGATDAAAAAVLPRPDDRPSEARPMGVDPPPRSFVVRRSFERSGGAEGPVTGPGDPSLFDRRHIRSLLVEDDASDARLTRESLERCPGVTFQIVHETRLASALNRLALDRFDLVILDLDLPDSRGIATCERVTAAHPQTPVVVLTGADDDATGVEAVQRGAQDFLSKNRLDSEMLSRAIRHALERHGMVARLDAALKESRRSALRLRNLIARSAEGFLVLDERGVVVLANPAAELLLGLGPDEATGCEVSLPHPTQSGGESLLVRADGSTFAAELRVTTLEWEGQPSTLVSIHDLSDRKRLERVGLARTVQSAILPDRTDKTMGRLRLCALHELCEDASGDYYDFIELDDERMVVAIGDVAGHGLGPALLMAQARAYLRAFCRNTSDLGVIMTHVNDALALDMTDGRFMSLFVASIDRRRDILSWCNGGHVPPFLRRCADREIERLEATGPLLGIRSGAEYGVRETKFVEGDLLVACSDGATEALSDGGEHFGESGVRRVVGGDASRDAQAVLRAVRDALERWTGAAPVRDDLTLVVVEAL